MSFPQISVVIPTRHRSSILRNLLASLSSQIDCDFEVLLVDDSDEAIERKTTDHFPKLNLKYIRGTVRGANRSRNLGLQQSLGEMICFLDDDTVLPSTQHLALLYRHMLRLSKPALLGGYYLNPSGSKWAQRIYNASCNNWLDKGFRLKNPILLGGNLTLRKQDLSDSIFFSEDVQFGGDEIGFHSRFLQQHPQGQILLHQEFSVLHDSGLSWSQLKTNSRRQQANNPTTWKTLWKWLQKPNLDFKSAYPSLIYVLLGKLPLR